jgi:AraC-like DNA-binding protein
MSANSYDLSIGIMEPLCAFENRKCVNCGFEDWPIVEAIELTRKFVKQVNNLTVLYVVKGCVETSFGITASYPLEEGDMMLFPPGTSLACKPTRPLVKVLMIKVKNNIVLCDKNTVGHFYRYGGGDDVETHTHLRAVPEVRNFMEALMKNIDGPLNCYRYMEIKVVELFHYLRAYYGPEDLAQFMQPLLSPNAQFMYFVWTNYQKVRNVSEFALLANYSLSAFKARFRSTTGLPPSQWMSLQRARNVFHAISSGDKTLKEISEEYHFSSVSHMGTFCRKHFGQSPGTIKPKPRRVTKKAKNV